MRILLFSFALLLISCNKEELCPTGYVLQIKNVSYSSCDPELKTFEYEIITTIVDTEDKCECEESAQLLEDSFWEIVNSQPVEERFMYYQVSPEYICRNK